MRIAVVGAGIAGLHAAWRLARAARRHAVRGGRLRRRPHRHRRRRVGRPQLRGRHRLHRLQRLDLPELHRAARGTRRRLAAVEHELQPALRAQRARVQRHLAELAVRAAAQCAAALVPAHARRHPALQPRAKALQLRRRSTTYARRSASTSSAAATRAQFVEHYIVPMGRAIWSAEADGDAGLPGPLLHRVLRPPRLPVGGRPPGVAGGPRRLARVRARAAARHAARPARSRRRSRRSAGCRTRCACAPRAATSSRSTTCSSPATRPGAAPARRRRARPSARCSARSPMPANEVVLHTDRSLLPRRPLARAAWNYHLLADAAGPGRRSPTT